MGTVQKKEEYKSDPRELGCHTLSLEFNHMSVNDIWSSQFQAFPALFKELCGLFWALFMSQLVKNTNLSLCI